MAQQYLSTDPNAGEPVEYLSLDPDTGEPVIADTPAEPQADEPSTLEQVGAFAKRNAPTLAALGVGLATGGASLPAQMLATGGAAYLGARLRGDERTDAAKAGVTEGALQLGGTMVGRGASALAKKFYQGLLKPSKAIQREFPEVVDDLVREGRLISPGGWFGGGLKGAEDAVEQAAAKADDLIAKAAPTATRITPKEIIGEFRPVVSSVRDRVRAGVSPEGELSKIGARGRRIVRTTETGPGLEIAEAQRLKKAAQDAAAGAYRQMRAGQIRQLGTDDLLDAATARGLRGALENRVSGLREANQATQRLIGQERALADAVGRTGNHLPFGSVSDLAAMGAGAMGGPLTGLAAKASTLAGPGSALAIALDRAGRKGLNPQTVRLLELLAASHDQEQ